jgi:hypothetical protein
LKQLTTHDHGGGGGGDGDGCGSCGSDDNDSSDDKMVIMYQRLFKKMKLKNPNGICLC